MRATTFLGLVLVLAMLMTSAVTVVADEPTGRGGVGAQTVLGNAFTYEGYLKQNGSAVTGTCDFQFSLWDDESSGAQVGSTQTKSNVSLANGLFTVELDFGSSAFNGQARWLEISVRCPAGSGDYTTLTPRQALTATPNALYATTAASATTANTAITATTATAAPWSGLTGIPAGFADNTDNDSGGTITSVTAGSGLTGGGTSGPVTLAVSFGGSGSADTAARGDHNHNASYWSLTGNAGTTDGANFLGTTDNMTLTLAVNNTAALRLAPNATSPNLIGGFSGNSATSGVVGATIGGGGASGNANTVTDDHGTVGGGYVNRAGDNAGTTSDKRYATVGGGYANTASGSNAAVGGGSTNTASGNSAAVGGGGYNTASGDYSAVGGGLGNTASGGWFATVGGGGYNTASADGATVGGGQANTASGASATVAGGKDNTAAGDYSFAAGRRAKIDAAHDGTFLFADQTDANFNSSAANEFAVRATGGARFVTNSAGTTGVTLAAGGGSWASISDRNLKANFAVVDGRDALRKVVALPITTWNYQSQDPSIRHMGPVAQDFYAAFGLGEDDLHISTVDADGVALAAIQGLYQALQDRDARISQLEAQLAALETRLAALEARVVGGGGQ